MSDSEFIEIDEEDADDADLVIGGTSSENSEGEIKQKEFIVKGKGLLL